MNDTDRQVLRTAAERLLAVADGATLEYADGSTMPHAVNEYCVETIGSDRIRIRPPAAPPEPKPSQAVTDACKRLGVEAWKYAEFSTGDVILSGVLCDDAESAYAWTANYDQSTAAHLRGARYWHVRPIAQAAPPWLPCPPRPTPEQVENARMPDGRKVKPPTVCEVPNGRAYFNLISSTVSNREDDMIDHETLGLRRWIAEPLDDVVTPWALDPKHAGKVVVRKADGLWGTITHGDRAHFHVAGFGWMAPENLLRDWTHMGKPCGDVAK